MHHTWNNHCSVSEGRCSWGNNHTWSEAYWFSLAMYLSNHVANHCLNRPRERKSSRSKPLVLLSHTPWPILDWSLYLFCLEQRTVEYRAESQAGQITIILCQLVSHWLKLVLTTTLRGCTWVVNHVDSDYVSSSVEEFDGWWRQPNSY